MNKSILAITGGTYVAGTELVTLDVVVAIKKMG